LVNAVDRFVADRGPFVPFAATTIIGEIRRHLRDHTAPVHVPRPLQDLRAPILAAHEHLTQTMGRTVYPHDIANFLGIDPTQVRAVAEAGAAQNVLPLTITDPDLHGSFGQNIDINLSRVEDRVTLAPHLAQLDARQRTIVTLRFAHGLSQSEIAERVGLSQMHVSRILRQSLALLRASLGDFLPLR
jgi:RNA polymerase sigma-B factor